jgi:diguanylate cyclase (GGDEF)-like protein
VVDAFDAMTSYRPYRDPQTFQKARDEIRKAAGGQFDPSVVSAFLRFSKDEWAALRETSETQTANGRGPRDMGSLRRIGSGQLQALNLIIAAITSSLDMEQVQQRCVDALVDLTRAASAGIYTLQGEGGLAFAAGAKLPVALTASSTERLAELLGGPAIREGITQFYANLAGDTDARAGGLRELNADWKSALILPMPAGDQTLGALALFSGGEHVFDEDERNMFDHIAKQLAQALVNARAHERVRVQAITDALTGAYNRHYLDDFLSIEVKRCSRYQRPLAVLMLDLDHFRQCNERAGHQGGDRALQDVVHLINLGVRSVDLVARYGGEEFTVVLPETEAQGAFEVAERIRGLVAEHHFPCGQMTVSIGVAASSYAAGDAPDAAELVRRADQALYKAKQEGRDRVLTWEGQAVV